jgi:hypothetical protein
LPDIGRAHNQSCLQVKLKVIIPRLSARIKQWDNQAAGNERTGYVIRLEQVARPCKAHVLRFIEASSGRRADVLDFEGKVEDGFRGVTVFAAVAGALGNEGVVPVHRWISRFSDSARRVAASSSACTSPSSSASSSALSVVLVSLA